MHQTPEAGKLAQSASTRPLCEYGSCQCTRLTDVSSEAGTGFVPSTAVLIGENGAAPSDGEADFKKRDPPCLQSLKWQFRPPNLLIY